MYNTHSYSPDCLMRSKDKCFAIAEFEGSFPADVWNKLVHFTMLILFKETTTSMWVEGQKIFDL